MCVGYDSKDKCRFSCVGSTFLVFLANILKIEKRNSKNCYYALTKKINWLQFKMKWISFEWMSYFFLQNLTILLKNDEWLNLTRTQAQFYQKYFKWTNFAVIHIFCAEFSWVLFQSRQKKMIEKTVSKFDWKKRESNWKKIQAEMWFKIRRARKRSTFKCFTEDTANKTETNFL